MVDHSEFQLPLGSPDSTSAARDLSYSDLPGPLVRIGILQGRNDVTAAPIGSYVLRSLAGDSLAALGKDDGAIRVSVLQARSAGLSYRFIAGRFSTEASARQWLRSHPDPTRNLGLTLLRLGHSLSIPGKELTTYVYWICSSPYPTREEASERGRELSTPGGPQILPERTAPPTGQVLVRFQGGETTVPDGIVFQPANDSNGRIVLHDVLVGVGFHWEHLENQKLRGSLEIRIDNRGLLGAINVVPVEYYLCSVNASEMMSACPDQLLRAQTIAARNTVLATLATHHPAEDFDLCADDHCQCYRGSSRETSQSRRAAFHTAGRVLVHDGKVCDCRYSKMCGGISENSDSVWGGERVPYLVSVWDGEGEERERYSPAGDDRKAAAFIRAAPDVFCNTPRRKHLPPHLAYSRDYFRWRVLFTREDFEASLNRFPEYRVGEFRDLKNARRGASGRIESLDVVGTKRTVTIQPEYEIRKAFAPFFLYSSAFVWQLGRDPEGRVTSVELLGAGWGHGVGMCQIGAAIMAEEGKSADRILRHYYRGSELIALAGDLRDPETILQSEEEVDWRLGDRCFEFFNCYAVARCPVYHRTVDLESRRGPDGRIDFVPRERAPESLTEMGIRCAFLRFEPERAVPLENDPPKPE